MQPTLHFRKKLATEIKISGFFENVLWIAFLIPSGSLSLVKYPVCIPCEQQLFRSKKDSLECVKIYLVAYSCFNLNLENFAKTRPNR
jgi:hypothetical protein